MTSKPNYFEAVNDIAAPQRGGEASGQAAAQATGRAAALGIEKTTDAIKFLGTQATEAFVGYKSAQLEKEIQSVINNTATPGYVGKNAQKTLEGNATVFGNNVATATGELRVGQEEARASWDYAGDASEAALLSEFNQKVETFKAGLDQGVFTRDQAITRIADAVKRYSADVPGLAQVFRKVAAEQTGVSDIDIYGLHKALTAKAATDKEAAANLELDKRIAAMFNLSSIREITPQHRALAREQAQLEFAQKNIASRGAIVAVNQTEADKAHDQVVRVETGLAFTDLNVGFTNLLKTLPGETLEDKVKSDQSSIQLDALISTAQQRVINTIMKQGTVSPSNPMPLSDVGKRLSETNALFDNYRNMLKSAEGRQMFAKMVDNYKGSVDLQLNQFLQANPAVQRFNALGLKEAFGTVFAAQGFDKKKLATQFGEGVANAMEKAVNDATSFDRIMRDAATDPKKVDLHAQTNPETTAAAVVNAKETVKDVVKEGAQLTTPKAKQSFTNLSATWGRTFNPLDPKANKEAFEFLTHPDVTKQLDPAQRKLLRGNFLTTIEKAQGTYLQKLRQDIAAFPEKSREMLVNAGFEKYDARQEVVIAPDVYQGGKLTASIRWVGKDAATVQKLYEDQRMVRTKYGREPVSRMGLFDEQLDVINNWALMYGRSSKDMGAKEMSDAEAYAKMGRILTTAPNERFYKLSDLAPVPAPTRPDGQPERRATPRVSVTPAERDKVAILQDELATNERDLNVLKSNPSAISPQRAGESTEDWKKRISDNISRITNDVESLRRELRTSTK